MKVKLLAKDFVNFDCDILNDAPDVISREKYFGATVRLKYQEYFSTGKSKGKPKISSYSLYFSSEAERADVAKGFTDLDYKVYTSCIRELKSHNSLATAMQHQKIRYFFDIFSISELVDAI
jgi:hypothetical protein